MNEDFANWFAREILVHEATLTRFISRVWRPAHEIDDLRHEVYVRILESAERQRPAFPKAFMFTTAKNLMVDRARRNRIVRIDLIQDLEALDVLVDECSPERVARGVQQVLRLTRIFQSLPERSREVVWMRKVEEIPQKQIAERLQIAEGTVEAHLVRGMRMLTKLFYAEERAEARQSGTPAGEYEREHGK